MTFYERLPIPPQREVVGVGHGTIYTDGKKAIFKEDNFPEKIVNTIGKVTVASALGAAVFLVVSNALRR